MSLFCIRKMKDILKWIPNVFTLANLGCGMIACWVAAYNIPDFIESDIANKNKWLLVAPSLFIFAASVFDFIDGFAARILKVNSELGKQLDSLADLVSFGVAPAFIILGYGLIGDWSFLGFFLGIFSAVRLAKFNNDTRQSESFLGLPVPSSGLVIASLPFITVTSALSFMLNQTFVAILIGVLCLLMVSEIPLIALKFKNFTFKDNFYRYLLLFIALISILIFGFQGISIVILGYVIISVFALKLPLS